MVQTLQGQTNICRRRRTFWTTSTRTTPENIADVREAILADRRQTIHDVCEIVWLSYGTVQRILADNLNMRRIPARFVPRLLSEDQKALRVSVCRALKQQATDDLTFISNIITSDETWVYGYDPKTKQQSSQWKSPNSPRPNKSASSSQQWQVHVDRFSTSKALSIRNSYPLVKPSMASFTVRFEASEGGHSAQTSRQVEEKQLVSPPWQRTRSHITRCSTIPDFQKYYSDSPPPPPIRLTSPPATFSYSPKMKLRLKGRRFDTTEEIHAETQEVIDTLIIENFQGCMKSWETCWDRCRLAQGDYFEGDGGN